MSSDSQQKVIAGTANDLGQASNQALGSKPRPGRMIVRMRWRATTTGLMFAMLSSIQAMSQTNLPQVESASQQRMKECFQINSFTEDFCKCAEKVSNSLAENDTIFQFFLDSANKKQPEIVRLYDGIIHSAVYDNHNFTSKEKREYVEGKFALFSHRLHISCNL